MNPGFERCTGANPAFVELARQLDLELWQRYPDIQGRYSSANTVAPDVHVVLAKVDGIALACGCWKQWGPGVAELKRMYVAPSHRRQGYARQIVLELIRWAKSEGCSRMLLQTGVLQPEAIALYEALGFVRTDNYPPYEGDGNSVCMELRSHRADSSM